MNDIEKTMKKIQQVVRLREKLSITEVKATAVRGYVKPPILTNSKQQKNEMVRQTKRKQP